MSRTYEDMLAPEWKKSLIIRGGDGFYYHAVLLPMFKASGNKGLEALTGDVLEGLHPAQMVNRIDNSGLGALYVMPVFFEERIQHQNRIKVIWSDDDALAGAGFHLPHADVAADVQTKQLQWLGWNFLRQNDLPAWLVWTKNWVFYGKGKYLFLTKKFSLNIFNFVSHILIITTIDRHSIATLRFNPQQSMKVI